MPLKKLIASFLIVCIKSFRPLLGPAFCLFWPTCTTFVCHELSTKPLFSALAASIKRLYSCSFFTR